MKKTVIIERNKNLKRVNFKGGKNEYYKKRYSRMRFKSDKTECHKTVTKQYKSE